jgi:acyl carrier protein
MAEVFSLPVAEIPADVTIEDLERWDSLSHLELMLALEMEFGVTISSDAMASLISLDAIAGLLADQGIAA